jgi:phosphoribosyl 1,2-cyclic phosphate phosphodiesterase
VRASVTFLGTGASGGTFGEGRSRRCESSLLATCNETTLLLDVTRDFALQMPSIRRIDAVLLTHAHRDATGGIARLRAWCREQATGPLALYAHPLTIDALRRRFTRLDHLAFEAVKPGVAYRRGAWVLEALEVPHAPDPRTPTYAWRLTSPAPVIVYASDVARLTDEMERFARDATLLVIDGAMWRRRLFTHLTIDAALPELCRWPVGRIALTQIGRSAPPHAQLARDVQTLCERAFPAYDGLRLDL